MWLLLVFTHHPVTSFHLNYITSDLTISRYGDLVTLMCRASDHYDLCLFISPDGETCQMKWDGRLRRPRVTSCSTVRRFEFVGSYDEFECGVKIVADAGAVGRWNCHVKEYRNFGKGRDAHANIGITFKQEQIENTSKGTSESPTITNNSLKLGPFIDKSSVRIPVVDADEDTAHTTDLTAVFVSVMAILTLVILVVTLVLIRSRSCTQSTEEKMEMISIQRENSRTSFDSDK